MAKNITKRDMEIISHLRQDARMKLRDLSKKTGYPVSTAFERLKKFRTDGLVKPIALVDFAQIGFVSRITVAIQVDREIRDHAEKYLVNHMNINTVLTSSEWSE